MKVMMQAVQCFYPLSMSVSVAFHYIILKDSCLLPHKCVSFTPIGVTAINAPRRIGCHIRCRGKSTLKWMKWSSSRRLNRSSCGLKDKGDGSQWFGRFQTFSTESMYCLCLCDWNTHTHRGNNTVSCTLTRRARKISPILTRGLFSSNTA